MSDDKNIFPAEPLVTIIPATFNEKDNIAPLIKKIRAAMKDSPYSYEILFADDSKDNTPEEIKSFTEKYSNISYLRGPGKGLSAAFIKAFEKARGKYIICMDADLQHPPALLPKLIANLEDNYQMSVASRYIPGGSNEGLGKFWSFYGIYRRLVSTSMSYLTRILFIPIRKTTDPMTGYFAFQKELLKNAKLEGTGFKILVEILMRTNPEKVIEVPLQFQPRENEESKATPTQGLNFFKQLGHLFLELPEAARFIKFCLVGLSGVIINLGLLYIFVEVFEIQKVVAFTISIAISILSNYFFNSRFTYRDNRSKSRRESIKRLGYYYTFAAITMFINLAIYHELINNFAVNYILAGLLGIVITVLLNFILVTKIIWKLPAEI
jgi:dolichol-phosphate mannosyltransferase